MRTVTEVIDEDDVGKRAAHYIARYRKVMICGPGSKPHTKAGLNPIQVLIKAWDPRPDEEE
jgi:hypothetical protein